MIRKMVYSFRQLNKYDDVGEVLGNAFLLFLFTFTILASVGEIVS
jgi:hypothetical protein